MRGDVIGIYGIAGQRLTSTGPGLKTMVGDLRQDRRETLATLQNIGCVLAGPAGGLSHCQKSHISAALDGIPRWCDPDLVSIATTQGHARALIEGYRRFGNAVLERMEGNFALALHDENTGITLLATDRNCVRPLFFARAGEKLVFATSADRVAAHPEVSRALSPQAIFNYLYFHVIPGPETIYQGVSRLQPGCRAILHQGRLDVGPYWRLQYQEQPSRATPQEWQQQFREHLQAAVDDAAGGVESVGAFLSGGTDSSTVAGFLGRITGAPARTYSIGFDAEGYDEMEYARIAARHFGTDHHEYYVTPDDVVTAIPLVAGHFDQPFGNASAIPAYFCARMAREDGIERLLAGDGGDELFGGNYRYAKQQMFGYYDTLPLFLRQRLMEPLLFSVPFAESVSPLRKLRNYVKQARIPMPERMETYNLLNRFGVQQVLTEDYLCQIDRNRPLQLLQEEYHGALADSMLNRMLAVDMRFTLADSDLPKVNRMCELADVEVRYPFLNDNLVAFAAGLPPEQKVNGTRLRYLFKEALRDFLPPEILTKKKQGFGLPFGLWLKTHPRLRELTRNSLENLKQRQIIRPAFIDELLGEHHARHAAYYGTLIWTLMMLEQWLAAHEGEGR